MCGCRCASHGQAPLGRRQCSEPRRRCCGASGESRQTHSQRLTLFIPRYPPGKPDKTDVREEKPGGFPGGSDGTEPSERPLFDPWVGKIPWRRRWQPTPVFLPGEFHGQRSLVCCSAWDHKESDMNLVNDQQ